MPSDIRQRFPGLTDDNHTVTSPASPSYNCIAWAAGDSLRWWEPVDGYFWPSSVSRDSIIASLVALFEQRGYVTCTDGTLEARFEKVALYSDNDGKYTHAAIQLDNGLWSSKLGQLSDISHSTPDDVAGGSSYGSVAAFMRRPKVTP